METSLEATAIMERLLRSWPREAEVDTEGQIKNKAYLNWQQSRHGVTGKRKGGDQFQSFPA